MTPPASRRRNLTPAPAPSRGPCDADPGLINVTGLGVRVHAPSQPNYDDHAQRRGLNPAAGWHIITLGEGIPAGILYGQKEALIACAREILKELED